MKIKQSGILTNLIFAFFFIIFLTPATAQIMTNADFSGNYYGARIRNNEGNEGTFKTALYEIAADGNGNVNFTTIMGNLDPLATTYSIHDQGKVTSDAGIIKGAISPDGTYLAIGKFSDIVPPQLLFAIKQSSDSTNAVIAGNYTIYLLYEITEINGETVVDSTSGYFQATDGNILAGNFAGIDQTFTGDYVVDYEVDPDGRLTLTFTNGQNASELGPMHGVVSQNGNALVAVDTTEEGARAYAVGIQEGAFIPQDLAGKYYVTDFGYFDLDGDSTRDDAAGSVLDFEAATNGTLSFTEAISTRDTCIVETEVTGTFTLNDANQFPTVFENYPCGAKTGGTLDLAPEGNVFSLIHQTYLGIGIPQASGVRDPVTELTADAGNDKVVTEGTTVTLDGSGSAAPEGDIWSYSWIQTGDGPTVELVNPRNVQAQFTVPDVDATTHLTFTLTVSDVQGNTASDSITITVYDASGSDLNDAPKEDEGTGKDNDGGDSCFVRTLCH